MDSDVYRVAMSGYSESDDTSSALVVRLSLSG
jgi:hypothetical protein